MELMICQGCEFELRHENLIGLILKKEMYVVRTLEDKSSIEKRAKDPVTHMPSRRFVRSVAFVGLVQMVETGKLNGLIKWVSG